MNEVERKLSKATELLEKALEQLENGGGNFDEVQRLEDDVNELYRQLETED